MTSSVYPDDIIKRVNVSSMVYKAINGQSPEYISDCLMKVSETHNRKLRSVDNDIFRAGQCAELSS